MLTEHEIARHWRNLFHRGNMPFDEQTFEKAEVLLDALRPESPLRHRLGLELDELKKQRAKKPARQTAKS